MIDFYNFILLAFSFLDENFISGILASLIAAALFSLVAKSLTILQRERSKNSGHAKIDGYWMISFTNRYSPEKSSFELFKFTRRGFVIRNGVRYKFKYQHIDSDLYKNSPLLGGGVALAKGTQVAGVYGFQEKPMILGTFLLREDDTTQARHYPRFKGSYYEFDGETVAQTNKNKYIFHKINVPLWKRIKFQFNSAIFDNHDEAAEFYNSSVRSEYSAETALVESAKD